ncbi:MAG TPA: C40 family peptidase [Azospira sp.]|nr:C40 family peptidase [Azospira sp.]
MSRFFALLRSPLLRRAVPLCAGAVLALAAALPARAGEESAASEPAGFLERYTNTAQDLILKGLEMVGVSYRRGGTDPDSGLDCSGFVQLVYRESIGKILPRTSREMSEVGDRVDRKELQPGDLVFFNTMRRAFSHVGIYLGEGRFLHSPRPGGEVRIEEMGSSYWVKRYNGARRVLEN